MHVPLAIPECPDTGVSLWETKTGSCWWVFMSLTTCTAHDIHIQLMVGYSSFLLPPQQSPAHISSCTLTEIRSPEDLVAGEHHCYAFNPELCITHISHTLYVRTVAFHIWQQNVVAPRPIKIIQPAKLIVIITQDQFWDDSNWFLHFSAGRLLAVPPNF